MIQPHLPQKLFLLFYPTWRLLVQWFTDLSVMVGALHSVYSTIPNKSISMLVMGS